MRYIVVCGLSGSSLFFLLLHHSTIFLKKLLNIKRVLISLQLLAETFSYSKTIERDILNVYSVDVKYPLFLSHCNKTLIFSIDFRKLLISVFMKTRTVGAEFFCEDRDT
jgi:hypothetical protein